MRDRIAGISVTLVSCTPEPEIVVGTAMRQSRYRGGVKDIKLTEEQSEHLVKLALKLGHFSVFEHISFTFAIEGISRACSHQLVRHRFFSFTQQSQRYVKEEGFEFIIPESIINRRKVLEKFVNLMNKTDSLYSEMLKEGIPAEDARFVLPNAAETKIVATANGRELMHFFKTRLDIYAQWEIRALAEKMFQIVAQVAPNIFNKENMKYFE